MLHSIRFVKKNVTLSLNYQFEGQGHRNQKLPKIERFSHIFNSIFRVFDVIWFVYLFFTTATTMPLNLK